MDDEVKLSPPPNVLLAGINGSTAYGLATEDSDIDRIGCFAMPTVRFHGLHPIGDEATWVSTKPDVTYHEAGKLALLLLACNPTASELIWLDSWESATDEGRALVAIRRSFLSASQVEGSYLRYASRQFRRLASRGDGSFSADTRRRTEKHARHMWRLLHQGMFLHVTGSLSVRLDPDKARECREFGEAVAAKGADVARPVLARAEEVFSRPGALPDRPDEGAAEAWLQDVRRAYWEDRP